MSRRQYLLAALAILIAALALRAGAAVWWQSRVDQQPGHFVFGDSESYWILATRIASGQPYQYGGPNSKIFRVPLYPMLIATLIDPDDPRSGVLRVRLLGCAMGTLAIAGLMLYSRLLFGAGASLCTGALAAVYPGAISMSIFVLSEAPFGPLMVANLLVWRAAFHSKTRPREGGLSFAAGMIAALAVLARPSWLLFAPFACLFQMLTGRYRKTLVMFVAMSLGFALVMSPWWIRSYQITGRFVLTTLQVGASMYDGLNPEATGASDTGMAFSSEFAREQALEDARTESPESTFEYRVDRRIGRAAKQWALANPGRVLQLALIKIGRTWRPWPTADETPGMMLRVIATAGMGLVIIPAGIGFWRYRSQGWEVMILLIPALYFTCLHAVFIGSMRYRLPAVMVMTIVAGPVVLAALKRLRDVLHVRKNKRDAPARENETDREGSTACRSTLCLAGASRFYSKPRHGRTSTGILLGLLFVAAGVCAWAMFPTTAGEQIRQHLLGKLREHYSDYHVDIASARYERGKGFVIEELTIRDAADPDQSEASARIDRIIVKTELSLQRLLARDFRPRKLTIEGLHIATEVNAEGRPAIEKLLPLPKFGPGADVVQFGGGTLSIVDRTSAAMPLVVRDLNGQILKRRVSGQETSQILVSGSSDLFEHFSLVADVQPSQWTLKSEVRRAKFDDALVARLPAGMRHRAKLAAGLSVVTDGALVASGDSATGIKTWGGKLNVIDGHYQTERLAYRIEKIAGEIELHPEGATVRSLTGRVGDADCRVAGETRGWSGPIALAGSIEIDQLMLHDRAHVGMPEKVQKVFVRLRPHGRVAIRADVAFDGQRWSWESVNDCLGLDVSLDRFPYPITDIRGQVHFSNRETRANGLVGTIGGREMHCDVLLAPPNHRANNVTARVSLATAGALPIDETLVRALTPRGQPTSAVETFVRSLNLSGNVELANSRFETRADGTRSKMMDLRFAGGNLRYDQFPYPVYDVGGRVVVEDDVVHIERVAGQSNDSALISTTGTWRATPLGASLSLTLDGYGIPLDQSLRRSLSQDHQSVWDTLGPSGVLEHLSVLISLAPGSKTPEITLTADQYPRAEGQPRFVSITPQSLPYTLNIARGHAHMLGDRVTIRDLEGWHGNSRLNATGRCIRQANGRWVLGVDVLPPTRIALDEDLLSALPEEVQGTFRSLELRGPPISMRGSANFGLPTAADPELDFDWDMRLQLEGNGIGDAGPIHDIRGELEIAGVRLDQKTTAYGTVRFDSMHAYDVQIVNVRGPIRIRDDQLYMGQLALGRGPEDAPRSIRGIVFGGIGEMDGVLEFATGRFDVNTRFGKIDFATLIRDMGGRTNGLTGSGSAVMRLEGLIGNYRTLSGKGRAQLREASLYELPVLVRLLNVLSVTPDQNANLSNCDLSFRVDGEQVHFDDMRIWGDLLVLRGEGSANLRQELDFRFETGVSPTNIWSRLLSPLRDQQYTLWTIDVSGTLADPVLDKRAMKQIEQTLERLFPELEEPPGTTEPLERAFRQDELIR